MISEILFYFAIFIFVTYLFTEVRWDDEGRDPWEIEDGREDPDFDLEKYMNRLDEEEDDYMEMEA